MLEWTLNVPDVDGNPFDLVATVTFTHSESGQERTTGMFHDGEDRWKFRFTGTRCGEWTFDVASGNRHLNGKRGTVTISPNPDPAARGFITAHGNKYARPRGEAGTLEAFVPNIYMNLVKFGVPERCGWTAVSPTFSDRETFAAYLDEAEAHGCNGVFARMGNQWFQAQAVSWQDHDSKNPDPRTFRAMEQAITQAHERGMFLHIWMWGDEQRKWTPVGVAGGVNGEADRRVQRYMAARLGPLPGWTMSYGSDLNGLDGPRRAVAVDTKQDYAEIDLGTFEAEERTWRAPHASDWVIAVGAFPDRPPVERQAAQRMSDMVFPGREWERATPQSQGVDPTRLDDAIDYLKSHTGKDGVRELVVVRNGRLIWQGDNIDKQHNVWSCTKSFTSKSDKGKSPT